MSAKTKLPYRLTDEPVHSTEFPPELEDMFEEVYYGAKKGKRSAIKKLLKTIPRYPHIPELKNWLYSAYKVTQQTVKARKMADAMVTQHPEYLFGILNRAQEYIDEGLPEHVPELLGESLELNDFSPGEQVWNDLESMAFESTASLYFLSVDDLEAAEERLARMEVINPNAPQVFAMRLKLMQKRIELGKGIFGTKGNWIQKNVDSFATYTPAPTTERPAFHHPEVELLYQHDTENFPPEVIEKLLELPRATFIADLEAVIGDGIARFESIKSEYSEWKEQEQSFLVHALRFLGHLEATESLQVILNLFRQDKAFIEYWFSDYLQELTWIPVYQLGHRQLDVLYDFVMEPHHWEYARHVIPMAVAQVAVHQPERREEVVAWFGKVFKALYGNPDDETRFDTSLITLLVSSGLDFGARELLPYIEQGFENEWIDPEMAGDLEEVREALESPADEIRIHPLPKDLYDHYRGDFLREHYEKIRRSLAEKPTFDPSLFDSGEEEKEVALSKYSRTISSSGKPFQRENPKVGRNDPCPCGSGKKYKKCCGRK